MPRRPIVLRKKISYDPRFNDPVVGKFLSILMKDGKRSTVERVCYGAFDLVQEKTGNDPLKVFHAALGNVKPVVEVKSRRVGRCILSGASRDSFGSSNCFGFTLDPSEC